MTTVPSPFTKSKFFMFGEEEVSFPLFLIQKKNHILIIPV